MKLRDEIAKAYDEGPSFVLESTLATHLLKHPSTDLKSVIQQFYQAQGGYVPFYLRQNLHKFQLLLSKASKALPPKPISHSAHKPMALNP